MSPVNLSTEIPTGLILAGEQAVHQRVPMDVALRSGLLVESLDPRTLQTITDRTQMLLGAIVSQGMNNETTCAQPARECIAYGYELGALAIMEIQESLLSIMGTHPGKRVEFTNGVAEIFWGGHIGKHLVSLTKYCGGIVTNVNGRDTEVQGGYIVCNLKFLEHPENAYGFKEPITILFYLVNDFVVQEYSV